jgi:hypothetical protein
VRPYREEIDDRDHQWRQVPRGGWLCVKCGLRRCLVLSLRDPFVKVPRYLSDTKWTRKPPVCTGWHRPAWDHEQVVKEQGA